MKDPFYRHLLYRLFAEDGSLLYVGRTNDLRRRMAQHSVAQMWWAEAAKATVESFSTLDALCEAERVAILAERPRHNVVHNGRAIEVPARQPCEHPRVVFLGMPLHGLREVLRVWGDEHRAIQTALDAARPKLAALIVNALRAGVSHEEVHALSGYRSRETVRAVARANGYTEDGRVARRKNRRID